MKPAPPLARARRGFTLLEMLIATAITVMMVSLVGVIWQSSYKAVERARSILAMDIKARQIMDRVMSAVDNRCGVLPMAAQNEAYGSSMFYRFRVSLARCHVDYTKGSTNSAEVVKESAVGIPTGGKDDDVTVRWNRPTGPNWNGWRTPPATEPNPDPYSLGQPVQRLSIGTDAVRWAAGEVYMWLSTVSRFDLEETYRVGTKTGWYWRYPIYNISGYSSRDQGGFGYAAFESVGRRYTSSSQTWARMKSGGSPLTYSFEDHAGPYRNVTINPIVHKNDAGAGVGHGWLGRTHIMRVINGPGYWLEPWRKDGWVATYTDNYGPDPTSTVGTQWQNDYEPKWWGDVPTPVAMPDSTDPAKDRVKPRYGARIEDGSVRWRVEAPHLFFFQTGSPPQLDIAGTTWNGNVTGTFSAPNSYAMNNVMGPYTSRSWLFNGGRFNQSGGVPRHFGNDYEVNNMIYAVNVSALDFKTSRMDASNGLDGCKGIFGSLTNASWCNNKADENAGGSDPRNYGYKDSGKNRGATSAGFMGSDATGNAPPGHPAWMSTTIGVVGGFDEANANAIERRWSLVIALR